jgi:ligand-binding sensor domain-containing protein
MKGEMVAIIIDFFVERKFRYSRFIAVVAILLAIALSVSPRILHSEGGPGDLWQTFTVNDGLGPGSVFAIFPAQDGALWFGTETGASRYDGRWRSISERDGLPPGRVRAIAQTRDGSLWFGTRGGGVGRCAADGSACARRWTVSQGLPDNDVRALLADGSGAWVGTARGLAHVDGERVAPESRLNGVEIWSLARGADGSLLVGTAQQGVWRRDSAGTWQNLRGATPLNGNVFTLWAEKGGRVWAGTDQGLFFYEKGSWQPFAFGEGDERPQVFALASDRDGNLWAGTDQGLVGTSVNRAPGVVDDWLHAQPGGLINDYVRALALDGDGGLWVGTLAGANRYARKMWEPINDEAMLGQRITAILTDSDGRTWVGTDENGLSMWDGEGWQRFTKSNGLPDDRIMALYQDSRGQIWVSTGTGVGYRTPAGKWLFYGPSSGIAGLPVYSIGQDASGALHFGTQNGVSRLDAKGVFQPVDELAGMRVNAVHRGRDGTLWYGTERDGLFSSAGGQVQSVRTSEGGRFGNVVVNGIVTSPDGTLWVATYDDGLWQRTADGWQRVDAPLATPRILSLKHLDDSLWVGTRQGFSRYDGTTWQSYLGDGLPSPEVSAIAPGREGVVWVGTSAGLVRYAPEKSPPWVKIESINLVPPADGTVSVTSDRIQDVRLIGGDLATRPEQLAFLTQLEGVDSTPQVHSDGHVALSSRRLAPGTYRLRAWARDSSLNYSLPAEVKVVVPPVVRLPGGSSISAGILSATVVLGLLAIGGLAAAGGVSWQARQQAHARAAAEAARQHEALERHFNPYISGEPVRPPEMFFGRDELLRKILNALHQNSIMIYGERRLGKTTLLYQLGQALRDADDPEYAFIPVSVDLEGTPQERFFYLLMEAIWGVSQAYLTEAAPSLIFYSAAPSEYTDREFSADLRELVDMLKISVTPRQLRIVLLIDEMDVIDSYERLAQLQLRRVFMSPLAENLGAVVAGIQISKSWDRVESPWFNLFNEFPLEPFDDDQARELLIEPVRGVYEWEPAAIDFVVACAEGRPYRLQQIALEAVNQMLSAGRLRITLEDAQAAEIIIEHARADTSA